MKDDAWYCKEVYKVFAVNPSMIEHTQQVTSHALFLCDELKCSEKIRRIVFLSALLHDIGIEAAFQKYQSREGIYQHIEGPPIAKNIMEEAGEEPAVIERVVFLVGNHHHFDRVDGLDFQILVEADMLVNLREEHLSQSDLIVFVEHFFKTGPGISKAKAIYLGFQNE